MRVGSAISTRVGSPNPTSRWIPKSHLALDPQIPSRVGSPNPTSRWIPKSRPPSTKPSQTRCPKHAVELSERIHVEKCLRRCAPRLRAVPLPLNTSQPSKFLINKTTINYSGSDLMWAHPGRRTDRGRRSRRCALGAALERGTL